MRYLKILFYFTLISALALTFCTGPGTQKEHVHNGSQEIYTCPMHPQVISDKPGVCPICGMNLVLKTATEPSQTDKTVPGTITLSPEKQSLAQVATVPVRLENIIKSISAYSYLDFAEPNRKLITARFDGRIEKLWVDKTGDDIQLHQPLFEIYSPDLIQAQNDYWVAFNMANNPACLPLLTSARKKLELLGITDTQRQELESTQEVKLITTYYSPSRGTVIEKKIQAGMYVNEGTVLYDVADLSVLWNIAEVFETDLPFVKLGNKVQLRLQSYPGEVFTGKIVYIYPVVNPQTRTIKIRSEFSNFTQKLRPQMYGETVFEYSLGNGLVVPQNAVLLTGARNIVWIEIESGHYARREVRLGLKFDGKYQILAGLSADDVVVSSGGYLIDSESQLKGSGN